MFLNKPKHVERSWGAICSLFWQELPWNTFFFFFRSQIQLSNLDESWSSTLDDMGHFSATKEAESEGSRNTYSSNYSHFAYLNFSLSCFIVFDIVFDIYELALCLLVDDWVEISVPRLAAGGSLRRDLGGALQLLPRLQAKVSMTGHWLLKDILRIGSGLGEMSIFHEKWNVSGLVGWIGWIVKQC